MKGLYPENLEVKRKTGLGAMSNGASKAGTTISLLDKDQHGRLDLELRRTRAAFAIGSPPFPIGLVRLALQTPNGGGMEHFWRFLSDALYDPFFRSELQDAVVEYFILNIWLGHDPGHPLGSM
ncbi:hypothetical protein NDU88_004631 [Pleurodeles waltl]|uniref:Uncharacterized protein n=1 Tax=Pleurodeles waltl TaxID=8319 RepID=A0AAV7WYE4_PLEWA|nr:hypothetical protein NDU88_004631 [Pleurodeles waltl]